MNCEVCNDTKVLSLESIMDILRKVIGEKRFKGDILWTQNAVAHLLWKLSAYGKALHGDDMKFVTTANLLHHILLSYDREFEEGLRSFF